MERDLAQVLATAHVLQCTCWCADVDTANIIVAVFTQRWSQNERLLFRDSLSALWVYRFCGCIDVPCAFWRRRTFFAVHGPSPSFTRTKKPGAYRLGKRLCNTSIFLSFQKHNILPLRCVYFYTARNVVIFAQCMFCVTLQLCWSWQVCPDVLESMIFGFLCVVFFLRRSSYSAFL